MKSKIRKQHTIRISNYHVIRKNKENPGRGVGGGVAILIRKDIKCNQLDTSEFDEKFLAISFESDKRKIALATIYNPPGTSPRGPGRYSDRSLFRQVDIPTGRYSDRSIFRQTGRYSDRSLFRQVDIPAGRYSDRSIFRQTGRYSDRSIVRQTGRYSDRTLFRQVDSPTNRSIFRQDVIPTGR